MRCSYSVNKLSSLFVRRREPQNRKRQFQRTWKKERKRSDWNGSKHSASIENLDEEGCTSSVHHCTTRGGEKKNCATFYTSESHFVTNKHQHMPLGQFVTSHIFECDMTADDSSIAGWEISPASLMLNISFIKLDAREHLKAYNVPALSQKSDVQ